MATLLKCNLVKVQIKYDYLIVKILGDYTSHMSGLNVSLCIVHLYTHLTDVTRALLQDHAEHRIILAYGRKRTFLSPSNTVSYHAPANTRRKVEMS